MDIEIGIPFSLPLIECKNCNIKFSLLAILEYEEDEMFFHDTRYRYMLQARAYFCPYCGVKQEVAP